MRHFILQRDGWQQLHVQAGLLEGRTVWDWPCANGLDALTYLKRNPPLEAINKLNPAPSL